MGQLEQIFLIVLGFLVVLIGILALVCWLKTKRKKEIFLLLKIGAIALTIVILLYVAIRVLN